MSPNRPSARLGEEGVRGHQACLRPEAAWPPSSSSGFRSPPGVVVLASGPQGLFAVSGLSSHLGCAQHRASLLPAPRLAVLCTSSTFYPRPQPSRAQRHGERSGGHRSPMSPAGVDLGLPLPAPEKGIETQPRCPSWADACSSGRSFPLWLLLPLRCRPEMLLRGNLRVFHPPVLVVLERRGVCPREQEGQAASDCGSSQSRCAVQPRCPQLCLAVTCRPPLLPPLAGPSRPRRVDLLPGGHGKDSRALHAQGHAAGASSSQGQSGRRLMAPTPLSALEQQELVTCVLLGGDLWCSRHWVPASSGSARPRLTWGRCLQPRPLPPPRRLPSRRCCLGVQPWT